MNGPSIQQVAAPGQGLPVGGEVQSGQFLDGSGGPVLAGNPLRVVQRKSAGTGRESHARVEDLARSFAGVQGNRDVRSWDSRERGGEPHEKSNPAECTMGKCDHVDVLRRDQETKRIYQVDDTGDPLDDVADDARYGIYTFISDQVIGRAGRFDVSPNSPPTDDRGITA
jgi:hypothetical protein